MKSLIKNIKYIIIFIGAKKEDVFAPYDISKYSK